MGQDPLSDSAVTGSRVHGLVHLDDVCNDCGVLHGRVEKRVRFQARFLVVYLLPVVVVRNSPHLDDLCSRGVHSVSVAKHSLYLSIVG